MYKKNNVIYQKSFDFALEIVKLYKSLIAEKKEYVLRRQILKSGTSIGANVREADETIYWIELLYASEFIEKFIYGELNEKAVEIIKIIKAIIITSKKSLNSKRNNDR